METKTLKILRRALSVLLLMLFCFTSASAQVDGQLTQEFPEEELAMEIAKKTVQAYESGDWDVIRNHVTPDAYFYNLGSFDSLTVEEALEYWQKGRETASPLLTDPGTWLSVTLPEGPRQGNWVLHWGENTLSYPNGETITFPYHVALKFEGDKVSQAHFYYDNNTIIRAMGFELQPPLNENQTENGMGNVRED